MKNSLSGWRSPAWLIHPLRFIILTSFIIWLPRVASAQTNPLSFTAIPYSDPDIISPRRGMEQWHGGNDVDPSIARPDVYHRFTWNMLETTQGNYTWTYFDALFDSAIVHHQKISFGIMTCYPDFGIDENGDTVTLSGQVEFDTGFSAYPEYLHDLMQAETHHDWKTLNNTATTGFGLWVPNWNSPSYLARLLALYQAVNYHLNNTTINGVLLKNVVNSIDVRGYGSYGEWHSIFLLENVADYPFGTHATVASLKTILDHHVTAFPDFPLSLMIAAFDAEFLNAVMVPKEVTSYALGLTNNWGKLGWRRDAWGATDTYFASYLENNDRNYNGGPEPRIAIMDRWKYAPITGEPPGWPPMTSGGDCAYDDLLRQITLYHASSFGNGNYGITLTTCIANHIRDAEKASGYRIILTGGSIASSISKGTPFALTLDWKNTGIAPTYENWNVVFELRNSSNATVWSANSQFAPKLFLPATSATPVTDNLTIPTSVADGNYTLHMVIKDPVGYRDPLPLAITGRHTDGSYTIASISLTSSQAILNGTVVLQGRPAAPNAALQVPLVVKLLTSSSTAVATYNVTTNQNGQFTINNITPGTYHISVNNVHTLSVVKLSQALVAGNNSISFGELLSGDVDGDEEVNMTDLNLLLAAYNTEQGEENYNALADMNDDGYVSAIDLGLLLDNFHAVGEYITPGCPANTVSITADPTCDGNNFDIVLSTATGVSPFDIRINDDTYTNIGVNNTIVNYALPIQRMWDEPVSVTSNEDNAVTLGVRFKTRQNGYIKGVRFRSPNNINGVYTGQLWSSGGTLLASATFSNVTASEWQEVLFSAPVFVTEDTVYIASYHTAGGRYSSTSGGMSTYKDNDVDLLFFGGSDPGGNGVYAYGSSPAFPSVVSSGSHNYWVDVMFIPAAYTFKVWSIIGDTGCVNTRLFQTLVVHSDPCEPGPVMNPPVNRVGENTFNNYLRQNIPNPSRGSTVISYGIANAGNVNLVVYDMNGRRVKVLVNGTRLAGNYSVNTGYLTPGVYVYRIRAGNYSAVKKMVIE